MKKVRMSWPLPDPDAPPPKPTAYGGVVKFGRLIKVGQSTERICGTCDSYIDGRCIFWCNEVDTGSTCKEWKEAL